MSVGARGGGSYRTPERQSNGNRPSSNALFNRISAYRTPVTQDVDASEVNAEICLFAERACSIQAEKPEREFEQGAIRGHTRYCIMFDSDPMLATGDLLTWRDQSGIAHNLRVEAPSVNEAGLGVVYYVEAVEITT